MSNAISNNMRQLSERCRQVKVADSTGTEIFNLVDLLVANPRLRRSIFDGTVPVEKRNALLKEILGSKLGPAAYEIVNLVTAVEWGDPRLGLKALERQGVAAQLRYAADQADDADTYNKVSSQLAELSALASNTPELIAAITDQSFDLAARRALVAGVIPNGAADSVVILAKRAVNSPVFGRVTFAENIHDYIESSAQILGRKLAIATAARPLTDQQRRSLSASLSKIYGQDIDLLVLIDESVIGGVKVEVGEEVIDGTVRAKLAEAERAVKETAEVG